MVPAPPHPSSDEWADGCTWDPAADAKEFAADLLHRLYLGPQLPNADPAPGAGGGCTGQAFSTPGKEDRFAYVIGTDANAQIKSVAVVSKQFGIGIFLAPAAKPILGLIGRYGELGGWPRTDVGRGDYYGVRTPNGTAILMRYVKVIDDGRGRAEPYVLMLPAAAALWLDAMRRHGKWLYVRPGGTVRGGKTRLRLVANLSTNKLVEAIIIDPKQGLAHVQGKRSSLRHWGYDMHQDEVEKYAHAAL